MGAIAGWGGDLRAGKCVAARMVMRWGFGGYCGGLEGAERVGLARTTLPIGHEILK
ncbi:MAG TPA: hypothetical protein PK677_00780 [Acidiphilium sp.]|nr:hypothetical protein [Acidiphilium sp.]HQU22884.1 hypothetical protein [Acidiphilium sp.]